MATITSTKPGEIGGTSILSKRSPTYRLVLKVDPTTGQYKYEYEVDDAPKVSDVIQSATPVVPEVPGTPDPSDPGDSSPTPGPTPEDPGTSFEQTKKMLGGGGGRDRERIDSGEYRMNPDGTVGYRRANQENFITVSETSPGAQRFMAGLTKGVSKVTDTIGDYISTGGLIGSAVRNIFSGSEAAQKKENMKNYTPGYNMRDVAGEVTKKPTDNRRPDSIGVADNRFGTFDQTADALTGGTVSYEKVYTGTAKQIQQKKGPFKMVPKVDTSLSKVYTGTKKQQLQKKGPFDLVGPTSNFPQRKPDMPTQERTLTGPRELGATTRSDIGEAVREGDIEKAVDIAKTTAGSLGQSRDKAQTEMDKARIGATTNNAMSGYGSNIGSDRRQKEQEKDVASAREAAKNTEAEKGRTVDRDNAVDNAARSNEVSDANGNAVTNNGKAINFGGKKESKMMTREDVAANKAKKDKEKAAKGDKGDKKGRIICSELYRQGLISKEDYVLDLYYTSKHLTSQHTSGYWHFAVPAVKAMRRSKFWTAFWREIAYNRLQDIKWRLGYGKFTLKGRIYSAIFEPFCYVSGYFKSNATYKELYKGEY